MNKILTIFLMLALAADLAGCASVQKKFTRKKKTPQHVAQAVAFDPGASEKKFSNEYYYKTHFTYWKAWQGEWIDGLAGNRKRSARNGQEALSHLEQLPKYLKPETAQGLEDALKALRGIQGSVESGQMSGAGVGPVRTELEKWRRILSNNYSFESVKNFLLPDAVDLGGEPEASGSTPAQ